MKKYGKKPESEMTDIEKAVDEGMRRYHERVLIAYGESGSVIRAAQHLRMDEETVRAIVEKMTGDAE